MVESDTSDGVVHDIRFISSLQIFPDHLSDDNYMIWKQHMLSAVRGYGLEEYLTGEKSPPPRMITTEAMLNPAFT